jgi:hypothetical protein
MGIDGIGGVDAEARGGDAPVGRQLVLDEMGHDPRHLRQADARATGEVRRLRSAVVWVRTWNGLFVL